MKITRIYTGDDGQSHFEELDIPWNQSKLGAMTDRIPTTVTFFRDTSQDGPAVYDFHTAPARQFVIHLSGRVEIEVGSGEKREFGVGAVLLADDTTGQGHISREIEGPRTQIFSVLADEADINAWR